MNKTALFNWLAEPSTVRGLVQFAGAAGIYIDPTQIINIVAGLTAVVGMINMYKKDVSKF